MNIVLSFEVFNYSIISEDLEEKNYDIMKIKFGVLNLLYIY